MANEVNTVKPDSAEDEPIAVTAGSNQSLLRPPTPKGIAFNKKLIIGITAVLGTICALVMIYTLSPPQQATPSGAESAQSQAQKAQSATDNTAMMPQEIAKLSESYGDSSKAGQTNSVDASTEVKNVFPGDEANPFFDTTAKTSGGSVANSADTANQEQVSETQQLEMNRQSGIRFASLQNLRQNTAAAQNTGQNAQTELTAGNKNVSFGVTGEIKGNTTDQNNQDAKIAYLNSNQSSAFYSAARPEKARSEFEVKASTIIPAVLITGINSDLPGYISAQVRENVYDSIAGKYLLIPQGSRLVGSYDSKIAYAQSRVMVIWTRLIFPNGSSLDLESIPGVDLSGYSGLNGKVNNHWGKLLTGVVITSLLSIGTVNSTNDHDARSESTKEIAGAAMAQNMSEIGSQYVERNFNVQPTIKVKPGAKFNVFVVKDFILQPYAK
jgi:type IV secretory pathway VirB10-like protein